MCPFVLGSLVIFFSIFSIPCIIAQSPSFIRDSEIDDDPETGSVDNMDIGNLPLDIVSTSFTSNGKFMNGTIWLSKPIYFANNGTYEHAKLNYSMEIWSQDPVESDAESLIYEVFVYPENNGWASKVVEYEPENELDIDIPQSERPIIYQSNQTGLVEDKTRYVNLAIDLDLIGFPDDYAVAFETHGYVNGDYVDDFTLLDDAPPKIDRIVFDWPSVVIGQGEEKIYVLKIHALDLGIPKAAVIPYDANKHDNIEISFLPSQTDMPLNGTEQLELIVRAENDLLPNKIIIQNITVNATTVEEVDDQWEESFTIETISIGPEQKLISFLTSTYAILWLPLTITTILAILISQKVNLTEISKHIRPKDILTANSSVIAGVLIFLTIGGSNFYGTTPISQVGILTASIVGPFALSAIKTLMTGKTEDGIKFVISGFVYLTASIILITIVR